MGAEHKRYFLEIAYHGRAYHGWQTQPNALAVQEVVDRALSTYFRQPVATLGCGRTDTGVHARQFYAHFDLLQSTSTVLDTGIVYRLNALLPYDIAVKGLMGVMPDAHARFDALSRSYEYHIHFGKEPFLNGLSWQQRTVPDIAAMNEGAHLLTAYRDFSCFSKSNTQVFTNNCTITAASWEWISESRLVFRITADRFLRNMVRAIVGTLMDIGWKKIVPADIHTIIASKDRSNASASVPACGLYLNQVCYPAHIFLEPRTQMSYFDL